MFLTTVTPSKLRSAASGWQIRDAVALLLLVLVYRVRASSVRRLAVLAATLATAVFAFLRTHAG
jgi:hypothetical protein